MDLEQFMSYAVLRGINVESKEVNDKHLNPVLPGKVYKVAITDPTYARYATVLYKKFGEHKTILECTLRFYDRFTHRAIEKASFDQIIGLFVENKIPR